MGLVQYDSSDEEEENPSPPAPQQNSNPSVRIPSPTAQHTTGPTSTTTEPMLPTRIGAQQPAPDHSSGPLLGPALGPSRPPAPLPKPQDDPSSTEPQQDEVDLSFLDQPSHPNPGTEAEEPPRSPYSTTRALLHNLTLPSVPNMDIPPSPPGSPPRGHDALTAKFDTFLRLKRGPKPVHFNERLAAAQGMKNPALMDKLMAFVGVETEFSPSSSSLGSGPRDDGGDANGVVPAVEQYATVLSAEVWDPACFPAWAYRGPLRRAQERVNKERERVRGEPVEFVSAGSISGGAASGGGGGKSAAGSRAGTPGLGVAGGTGKRSLKGKWDT